MAKNRKNNAKNFTTQDPRTLGFKEKQVVNTDYEMLKKSGFRSVRGNNLIHSKRKRK